MRLILGLPPPHRPHFPSSVSTPHRSPPPFPFPRLFPCLPSRRSLYRSQPGLRLRSRFRSGSRTCFRVCPALVSVPVSASVSASVPVPAPVSVPAPRLFPCLPPRRSLSQSQSSFQPPLPFPLLYPCLPLCLLRAGLCPSPCLGLRPASVSPALRSVRSSFRVPKVACRSSPAFSLDFSVFRSSPPLLLPCLLLFSLCQGWNSCISKFLVVHLRKI